LRDAARTRGIDPDRLLFAPRVPVAQHLRRLSCADVFLDTWPCNAHTTAGEALWVGVPVVSLQGEAFAQRVASSLLHALDLNDLVCDRVDAYAAQVLALADDAPRRAALRERLLQPHTLFDGAPMARALEALWTRMWQRALAGRKPAALAAEAA
jgi:predicted O-linked N-acetylglucosamine transferase (SPINDLY family)